MIGAEIADHVAIDFGKRRVDGHGGVLDPGEPIPGFVLVQTRPRFSSSVQEYTASETSPSNSVANRPTGENAPNREARLHRTPDDVSRGTELVEDHRSDSDPHQD